MSTLLTSITTRINKFKQLPGKLYGVVDTQADTKQTVQQQLHLGTPAGVQLTISQMGVTRRPNKQTEDAIRKHGLTQFSTCDSSRRIRRNRRR